jgi:O-antigen ligase
VVYCFYRLTPLPEGRAPFWTGFALLSVLLAGYLAARLGWAPRLLYVDPHMDAAQAGKLAVRYESLFSNPNYLGSAYIIPVLPVLPEFTRRISRIDRWWKAALAALLTLIVLRPLFSTASKHMIMTMALVASAFVALPLAARWKPAALASLAIAIFGALCLITVYFRTYPAVHQAPWVDFAHRGNYSVHQEIYAKIIWNEGPGAMLFGHSSPELHLLYPKYADAARIRAILAPYGMEDVTDIFSTFMDPHNEYLNFAAFFGVPALAFLLAFLLQNCWRASRRGDWALALWIPALLLAMCWDDLGSKRWIWAALGILAARNSRTNSTSA